MLATEIQTDANGRLHHFLTIDGLSRFLNYAQDLISQDGQILLDSLDVAKTDNPQNLAYHRANREAGRYIGEISLQFEFQGESGPYCSWLHIDARTLADQARKTGWKYQLISQEENGNHLSKLTKGK